MVSAEKLDRGGIIMKKSLAFSIEIILSLVIVFGLLWVAFYLQPSAEVKVIEPSPFGQRENYYGATAPSKDGRVLWAVGRKGRIIRSEDHGKNWVIQNSPITSVHLQDIDAWNNESAIIVGDNGTVLVTSDGGANWSKKELELRQFGEQLLKVHVEKSADRAWAVGAMGSVFVSDDRGDSWRMTHPEEDLSWNGLDVSSDGTVWVVGEFGRMSKSTDHGQSWEEVSVGADQSLMDVSFSDAQTGVAVGLSGTIFSTVDGGEQWQQVESGTDMHINDIAWDGEHFVAVGSGGILLASNSGGTHWTVGRLGENNSFWYTEVVPIASASLGRQYLGAGANLGISRNSQWQRFTQMSSSQPVKNASSVEGTN